MGNPVAELRQSVKKWLYLDAQSEASVDYVASIVVSSMLTEGLPLWGFLVAAPGSGKSTVLSAFADEERIIAVQGIKPNSLVSGFRTDPNVDPSLAAKLDGRCLIDHDFTQVLEMRRESRDELMGQLRTIYDGEITANFGNIGLMKYKARFSFVAGVTPVVDCFTTVKQTMGERFLMFRMKPGDMDKAQKRAMENSKVEGQMKQELQDAGFKFLRSIRAERLPSKQKDEQQVLVLAAVVAKLRSKLVRHEHSRSYESEPFEESPARLTKQLLELVRCHAIASGRRKVMREDFLLAERVARDTIPHCAGKVCRALYKAMDWVKRDDIAEATEISRNRVGEQLEDFEQFDIVESQQAKPDAAGRPSLEYALTSKVREQVRRARLFDELVQAPGR